MQREIHIILGAAIYTFKGRTAVNTTIYEPVPVPNSKGSRTEGPSSFENICNNLPRDEYTPY